MVRRLTVIGVAAMAMLLGIAGAPASAADDIGPDFSAGPAVNCNDVMADTSPRYFNLYTLEDRPPSPTAGGGHTFGYVWVDRRADGQGYNVCVGWPNAAEPFPYRAILSDNRADAHGAIVFASFIPWGQTNRVRSYGPRVDGVGNELGYNHRVTKVSSYYVGVCIIAGGVKSGCNDERGTD